MPNWFSALTQRATQHEKPDLVLHLGTEKTGTTALQLWAQNHRDMLCAHGVWVCQSLQTPNNFALAVYGSGLEAGADLLDPLGITSETDLDAFRNQMRAALDTELDTSRKTGCTRFLITSEHLHARITKPDAVTRIADLLKPRFAKITPVLVLRPQADLARSVQSNHLGWGVKVSDQSLVDTATGHNYDYDAIDHLWSHGIGTAPKRVAYKRHPKIVTWMVNFLKLPKDVQPSLEPRAKEQISLQGAALLNALADILPMGPAHLDIRQRLIQATAGLGQLTFSRNAAEQITKTYAASNARLCARVTDITPEDLAPDHLAYPERGSVTDLQSLNCAEALEKLLGEAEG